VPTLTRASKPSKVESSDSCALCGWSPGSSDRLWPSMGGPACDWIEDSLIFAEGDWFGQPFRLRQDQKLFLYRWYEHCGGCGAWRYREGLRGAATGDGKTAFVAAIACLEFAGPDGIAPSSPNIPISAASFEQADLLFGAAATMLGGKGDTVPEAPLCGLFDVYDTEIKFKGDVKPGRMHRVAAAAGTNEGGLPSLFICDELHEWGDVGSRKARIHTVIGKSTRKRNTPRGAGRILNLSTAGFDVENSLLGTMYRHGKQVELDPTVDPRFLFDWQEAPDDLDFSIRADREKAVRAASKAADIIWNVADRVADWDKPGFEHHEWIRYYANRWVDVAEDSWLADYPGAWSKLRGSWESSDANRWCLAIDMALRHDEVGLNRIEELPDGRFAVTSTGWKADRDGKIDHADIKQHLRREAKGAGFAGIVYDPRFFEVLARELEDEGILCVEFPQSIERMGPACLKTLELILSGGIVHNGDVELMMHVNAAAKRQTERGFTLSKGKSKRPIDRCIPLVMGIGYMHQPAEEPEQMFFAARR